jgi:DNA recombination protein RmuC
LVVILSEAKNLKRQSSPIVHGYVDVLIRAQLMITQILQLFFTAVTLLIAVFIWIKIRNPIGQNLEKTLRDEFRESRDETARQARDLREEVASIQAKANEILVRTVNTLGEDQKNILEKLTASNEERLQQVRTTLDEKLGQTVDSQRKGLEDFGKTVAGLTDMTKTEFSSQRERIQTQLHEIQKANEERFDKVREAVDEKLRQVLEDQRKHLADVIAALKGLEKVQQQEQEKAREALDIKFRQIQESNEKKLDEMRQTVDEKLHHTLEKRLGESFKLVSERLEAVQRGLGEMQTLATGVGDLKRVLGNVKERGTWGEYQLGAILSEILTPDQYAQNVRTKEGRESVEFAVKLPGRGQDYDAPVWLPIDSKFPKEAYERLVDAARIADADGVEAASNELRKAVIKMARDIQEKYINPPASTDFAILFLPTEGLYAEVLRQSGLHDEIQQKHRVLVAGPTTLSAILNSLRVGFQTLAIEKRASEVWTVLGAVKTEFGRFGEFLGKVKRHIDAASQTLDASTTRTKAMERKLKAVEQLPVDQAQAVLAIEASAPVMPEDEDENNEASDKI